jgi:hypothetical protein
MRSKLWIGVAIAFAAMAPVVAGADAPGGSVPPHQHYAVNGNGELIPIGPDACDDGQSRQFDNMHIHVHRGAPGGHGTVVGLPCPQ